MPADEAEIEPLVQAAIDDTAVLKKTLKGLVSKDEAHRYRCYQVLFQISQSQPSLLYTQWDYFVELLKSPNSYQRCAAINILANLTPVDSQNRFEAIFDSYFGLLDDPKLVPARYVARSAGLIARARPDLQSRIVRRLLDIDQTHHKQKDLLKADIIESLVVLYPDAQDKDIILTFVKEQLGSSSPKTRQAAQKFLAEFG